MTPHHREALPHAPRSRGARRRCTYRRAKALQERSGQPSRVWRGLCCLLLLFTGCMASGVKVEEASLRQFQAGVTTYQEVEARLGKANTNAVGFDGTRFLSYVYSQSQAHPANFVPGLRLFIGGEAREGTQVLLQFDPQGRLVGYTTSAGQMMTGTGIIGGAKP
jgi:hypothetical protein